jgi:hypothetical protein
VGPPFALVTHHPGVWPVVEARCAGRDRRVVSSHSHLLALHFEPVVPGHKSFGDFDGGKQMLCRCPLLNVRRKVLPVFPTEFDCDFVHTGLHSWRAASSWFFKSQYCVPPPQDQTWALLCFENEVMDI